MALFDFLRPKEKRQINKNASNPPRIIRDFFPTSSGIFGTDGTAFACIDRIASEFAGLNYGIYSTKDKQRVKRHNLYNVLKEPNLDDRHFNFFYQSAIDYFNGGCFWMTKKYDGEVVSLFRLNPADVTIRRNSETQKREYLYNGYVYDSKQIKYIPSRFDYSTARGGSSIFDAVRSTFDTAHNLEKYTQNSFKQGVIGKRLVIDVQGAFPDLKPAQALEIKNSFQAEYSGAENSGRPLLKKKGIEFSELGGGSDNQALQLSDNRKFQTQEIAKLFGIPPEMLSGVTSGMNLENTFVMFNEFALRPLATMFQEAINSMLDEERFYFEFDYNGVMKVSLQNRIDAYSKQINNGLLSPNEARAKENLAPIEAGDNHFMPVNLMPLNDETINAYMAKQKNEINENPTDPDAQHFGGGDDKQ